MPTFELIDLQTISYQEFVTSHIPEEVLFAILCNFGEVEAEMVVEEIFTKLRMLQESNLNSKKRYAIRHAFFVKRFTTLDFKTRTENGTDTRYKKRSALPTGREAR